MAKTCEKCGGTEFKVYGGGTMLPTVVLNTVSVKRKSAQIAAKN